MEVKLNVSIDDEKLKEVIINTEEMSYIDWNEIMGDRYDEYEDMLFAEECENDKESYRNYDKITI